jgi:hypothetical protein
MNYELDMGVLEIAITYICNVRCNNCLALSPQAPTRRSEDMTLADIQQFISDSIACRYPWRWIKLHGGEPTLHPQFMDICRAFQEYKVQNPAARLSVVSNDSHPDQVAAAMQLGLDPQISSKVKDNTDKFGNKLAYVPVNISPKDMGQPTQSGCWIPEQCGIALNNLGFWPCGPAAAAARVFNYEAPVKRVQDLSVDKLKTMYKHCEHCGFGIVQERRFEQITSSTWAAKLETYNACR